MADTMTSLNKLDLFSQMQLTPADMQFQGHLLAFCTPSVDSQWMNLDRMPACHWIIGGSQPSLRFSHTP